MDKAIDSCKLNPDIGGCKHFSPEHALCNDDHSV